MIILFPHCRFPTGDIAMPMTELPSRRNFLARAAAIGAAALATPLLTDLISRATAAPVKDLSWQIGCYTRPWANYDYRVAMDAIAEGGMKYVGLMTAKSQSGLVISLGDTVEHAVHVNGEAKRRGLEILSVYGGGINLEKPALAVAELRHLIDLSAAAGARTLLLGGIGNTAEYFRAFTDCCDYAAEKKVGLTIKPHG